MAYIVYSRTPKGRPSSYEDTSTGEILSNRQYLNRQKAAPFGFSTYAAKLRTDNSLKEQTFKLSKTSHTTYKLDPNGDIRAQLQYITNKHKHAYAATIQIEAADKSVKQTQVYGLGDFDMMEEGIAETEDKYGMTAVGYYLVIIGDS